MQTTNKMKYCLRFVSMILISKSMKSMINYISTVSINTNYNPPTINLHITDNSQKRILIFTIIFPPSWIGQNINKIYKLLFKALKKI